MASQTERDLRPHPAAVRLRATLDSLAGALTTVRVDALLASETAMADALAELARPQPTGSWSREATLRELAAARASLTRCRRLGNSLSDLLRTALTPHYRGGGAYGHRYADQRATSVRSSLDARA
jgi:hypothetical protein